MPGTGGSGVGVNPDGTPNYGSTGSTSGGPQMAGNGPMPVDGTGAIDIWNMPDVLKNQQPFWWATNHHKYGTIFGGPEAGQDRTKRPLPSTQPVTATAEDVYKQMAVLAYNDPKKFAEIQRMLIDANYFSSTDPNKVTLGAFDNATQQALGEAITNYLQLSQGAGQPIDFQTFLQKRAQAVLQANGKNPSGSGGGSLPNRPALTDPDTLRLYLEKAAEVLVGRMPTQQELDSFVNTFHGDQQAAFNNSLNGQGDVVDKNDPRASAIAFLQQSDGKEVASHKVSAFADAMLNDLLSGSPQLPQQPTGVSGVSY